MHDHSDSWMYLSENFLESHIGLTYNIKGLSTKNFEVMAKYRSDIPGLVQINIYMIYKICLDCVIVIAYTQVYWECDTSKIILWREALGKDRVSF